MPFPLKDHKVRLVESVDDLARFESVISQLDESFVERIEELNVEFVVAEEEMIFRFGGGNSRFGILLSHRGNEILSEFVDVRFEKIDAIVVQHFRLGFCIIHALEQISTIAEILEPSQSQSVDVRVQIIFDGHFSFDAFLVGDVWISISFGARRAADDYIVANF